MFIESNNNEQFEKVDTYCKQLLEQALQNITAESEPLNYACFDDLYANQANHPLVFMVEEGAVAHQQDGKTLFYYDAGDLFGFNQNEPMLQATYTAESPVVMRSYRRDSLWDAVMANTTKARQWGEYLIADNGRLAAAIASMEPDIDRASLGFASFQPGETIIEEGTEADTVYSIVEGHAEVFVKGVRVGEVLENEIFGALALLTNSPRTASVVADRRCLVMVVPRHQFDTLIKHHPHICMSLMENMARQIVALNAQIISTPAP